MHHNRSLAPATQQRASITTNATATSAAAVLRPRQGVARRRCMQCRGGYGWVEAPTFNSSSPASTTYPSGTKATDYRSASEHSNHYSSGSSSSSDNSHVLFPEYQDVPDFFGSTTTYQPSAPTPSSSTNGHGSHHSNGNGWDSGAGYSTPSRDASNHRDAYHTSSYEEAGGGFFYDDSVSRDAAASGDASQDYYATDSYSSGQTGSGFFSSNGNGNGNGHGHDNGNGNGNGYASLFPLPHMPTDSTTGYHNGSDSSAQEASREQQQHEEEEEEEEGGGGGLFTSAFAAALQAALQRSAESESSGPLTSQASYQEEDEALPRTPLPLLPQPRREEEPNSAAVDVLSAAFDASMTSMNRLMAIKGEVDRAIEREKLQLARLEFALDKTKKDEAYYKVLRIMHERGVSDAEDI